MESFHNFNHSRFVLTLTIFQALGISAFHKDLGLSCKIRKFGMVKKDSALYFEKLKDSKELTTVREALRLFAKIGLFLKIFRRPPKTSRNFFLGGKLLGEIFRKSEYGARGIRLFSFGSGVRLLLIRWGGV